MIRLMAYQQKHGYKSSTATVAPGTVVKEARLFELDSTYLQKGRGEMFRAGQTLPWLPRQGYFIDWFRARFGSLNKDMVSSNPIHESVRANSVLDQVFA